MDFSQILDFFAIAELDFMKLLAAIFVGGLIGAEREFRDKAAGFRTIILICVGATLFTMFSLKLGADEDPVRIAAAVVSGVGFLGAGAILRDSGGRVTGLTTASTIWLAAALGMGIGGGFFEIVAVMTVGVLIVLWIFPFIERVIDKPQEVRSYELVCALKPERYDELESMVKECRLNLRSAKQYKRGDNMICEWNVAGSPNSQRRLVDKLFAEADVKEFRF